MHCSSRRTVSRITGMLALAMMSLAVAGCITPAQELNWIEHRVSRNQVPRPSPLQVAGNAPRPASPLN